MVDLFTFERITDDTGFEFDRFEPPRLSVPTNTLETVLPTDETRLWSQYLAKSLVCHPSAPQILCCLFNQASRHRGRATWRLPLLLATQSASLSGTSILASRLYLQEPLTGEWEPIALAANHVTHAKSMVIGHPDIDPWPTLRYRDDAKTPHGPVRQLLIDFLRVYYVADVVKRVGLAAAIDELANHEPWKRRVNMNNHLSMRTSVWNKFYLFFKIGARAYDEKDMLIVLDGVNKAHPGQNIEKFVIDSLVNLLRDDVVNCDTLVVCIHRKEEDMSSLFRAYYLHLIAKYETNAAELVAIWTSMASPDAGPNHLQIGPIALVEPSFVALRLEPTRYRFGVEWGKPPYACLEHLYSDMLCQLATLSPVVRREHDIWATKIGAGVNFTLARYLPTLLPPLLDLVIGYMFK